MIGDPNRGPVPDGLSIFFPRGFGLPSAMPLPRRENSPWKKVWTIRVIGQAEAICSRRASDLLARRPPRCHFLAAVFWGASAAHSAAGCTGGLRPPYHPSEAPPAMNFLDGDRANSGIPGRA